jgi:hypothetical protein
MLKPPCSLGPQLVENEQHWRLMENPQMQGILNPEE